MDNLVVREPQHDSKGHIFDPNELEIPRMIIDVEVTKSPCCRIGYMVRNRCRNIDTFPTSQLSTEIEIRVLIVKKEIFIQKADPVEHATPI